MTAVHSTVTDGLRKFLRLQTLPLQEHQLRQNADVFDLFEGLEVVREAYADTGRMIGHQMHQGIPYSHSEDVKRAVEEFLLVREDARETAHLRKKNLTMYHLVLEPLIDSIAGEQHENAIQSAAVLTEAMVNFTKSFDQYGTEDDALVAKYQIKAMVKQREEARRLQKLASKKANRKRKRDDDDDSVPPSDDDVTMD